jgi:hypothetical protein
MESIVQLPIRNLDYLAMSTGQILNLKFHVKCTDLLRPKLLSSILRISTGEISTLFTFTCSLQVLSKVDNSRNYFYWPV